MAIFDGNCCHHPSRNRVRGKLFFSWSFSSEIVKQSIWPSASIDQTIKVCEIPNVFKQFALLARFYALWFHTSYFILHLMVWTSIFVVWFAYCSILDCYRALSVTGSSFWQTSCYCLFRLCSWRHQLSGFPSTLRIGPRMTGIASMLTFGASQQVFLLTNFSFLVITVTHLLNVKFMFCTPICWNYFWNYYSSFFSHRIA